MSVFDFVLTGGAGNSPSCECRQPNAEAGCQLGEGGIKWKQLLDTACNHDGNDKAVYGQDTRHDCGHDAYLLLVAVHNSVGMLSSDFLRTCLVG